VEEGKTNLLAWPGFRWIAVVLLLLGYVLVSQGYVDGKGVTFNVINSVGSILLISNSLSIKPKDWAVAVFNMVWLAISLFTILRLFV